MLLGLTGQIGAGKSTAAEILRSFGAYVIDADQIGREVVESNPGLIRRLAREFGTEILTPEGQLLRKELARRAFASEESRRVLNALVHPFLLAELLRQAKKALRTGKVVVIDAALLLEWGLDREVDAVVLLTAPRWLRFERLQKRGITPDDALARQKSQPSEREFRASATHVIPNDGTEDQLRVRLARLWKRLRPA